MTNVAKRIRERRQYLTQRKYKLNKPKIWENLFKKLRMKKKLKGKIMKTERMNLEIHLEKERNI